MKVVIVGTAPEGLIAAHTARLRGHEVKIIGTKIKAKIPAWQYMSSLPNLLDEIPRQEVIKIVKKGNHQGYARKAYGTGNGGSGWPDHSHLPNQLVHSLGDVYDSLWRLNKSIIVDLDVHGKMFDRINKRGTIVISTVPAQKLCLNKSCIFRGYRTYVTNVQEEPKEALALTYNGRAADGWFKSGNIFGSEFSVFAKMQAGAISVDHPVESSCKCPSQIYQAGSKGTWSMHSSIDTVEREVNSILDVA